MFERGLAEPARRNVDDAREGEVVLGIDHQVQVGEDVLDFLPLVERHSADDLVGNPGRAEGLLERTGERRHAAEDGDIGKSVLALVDQAGDPARRSPSASSLSRG